VRVIFPYAAEGVNASCRRPFDGRSAIGVAIGFACEYEVFEYRDMIVIVRDRFGAISGPGTADMRTK